MFVVLVNYLRPAEDVDALLEAHRAFLRRYYDAGVFLLSGPQKPRLGGCILARAGSRQELEAILQEDPFGQNGVASYTVIEFQAVWTAKELEPLREQASVPSPAV